MVAVVATPGEVKASVYQFSPKHAGEPEMFPYSRDLFDELWLESKDLGLAAFAATKVPDIGASENYVITIWYGMGDEIKKEMYLVPKCSASLAITSFVKRLTHDLLPSGSPGLFKPCPQAGDRGDR